jgi:PAS domain S-box-containing protein
MKGYIAEQNLGSPRRLTIIRYLGAVVVIAVAVVLALSFQPVIEATIFLLIAVVIAAWFSGLWPALLASLLATLAVDYFFTPPLYTVSLELAHIPRLVIFTAIAVLFAITSAERRRAELSLKEARDQLEAKVSERTADLTRAHTRAVQAHQRFRELVNSIEGIVWEADARTFQFTFVSQQAERILGYPAERWLAEAHFWKDRIHPDDRDGVITLYTAATAEGRDCDFEFRMLAADGRVVWMRDLVTVAVEGGEPVRLRGVMVDITARHEVQQRLHEKAALLDLTHDTIFVRDMNDVIRFWNRGAEELYGWSSDEAVAHVTHDLLRTVFPERLDRISAELLKSSRWEGELVHTKRDGSKVAVASRWSLQLDAEGRPIGILETNNDITGRKRAEAELGESERRYRHIFESVGIAIWQNDYSAVYAALDDVRRSGVTDVRAYLKASPGFVDRALSLVRVVDVNQATVKLFGARTKEELSASLARIFTPESRGTYAEVLEAIADGRSSFHAETTHRTLSGEEIIVFVSLSLPPPQTPNEPGLVSIMDITDRKRAEQELEALAGRLIDAQEEERRRIGRELHDHISQMLGVLAIGLDQLRAEETTPPDVGSALEQLRQNASEIAGEVHGLSHRLHSSTLDHFGLVPALQRLVGDFSTRHGIAIDFSHEAVPGTLPSEMALCLFRVAEESLTNIAKHSSAKSARVHLRGESAGLRLRIEDSGIGFDAAAVEHGGGLGFVSMRERLRALRGAVRVDSVPSRGTMIDVWLPAASIVRNSPRASGESGAAV